MVERIRRIAEMAYPDLDDIHHIQHLSFIFGSAPNPGSVGCQIQHTQTLDELEEELIKYDRSNSPKPAIHFKSNTNQQSRFSNIRQNISNDTRNTGNPNESRQPPLDTRPKPKDPTRSAPQVLPKDEKSPPVLPPKANNIFNTRCLNCWSLGHLYRDCSKITGMPVDNSRVTRNYQRMREQINSRVNIMNDQIEFPNSAIQQICLLECNSISNFSLRLHHP